MRLSKSRKDLGFLHQVWYHIISYWTQKRTVIYRSLKHGAASADAAHQRQLLLAAAASGSSSSRECVSHDVRPPTFVCAHAGPDTYVVQREVQKFNFPTSNRAKNRETACLYCYSYSSSSNWYQSKGTRYSIAVEMQQSEKQQPQQHSSSNAAAAKRQRPRSNIRIQRLSLSRFVRELSTAIHSRGSVATCTSAHATKEFSEIVCCSTKHLANIFLLVIGVWCGSPQFLRTQSEACITSRCALLVVILGSWDPTINR